MSVSIIIGLQITIIHRHSFLSIYYLPPSPQAAPDVSHHSHSSSLSLSLSSSLRRSTSHQYKFRNNSQIFVSINFYNSKLKTPLLSNTILVIHQSAIFLYTMNQPINLCWYRLISIYLPDCSRNQRVSNNIKS